MEIMKLDQESRNSDAFRNLWFHGADSNKNWLLLSGTASTFFGAFIENRLCGVIELEENSRYLVGGARIKRVQVFWQWNTEVFLEEMIRLTVSLLDTEWICMDVHERHDYNFPVYERLGFRKSLMTSPVGEGYCVLVARKQELMVVQKNKM